LLSYKQQKFNLFREETEGYSKLIVELDEWISSSDALDKVDDMLSNIQSLIGFISLYPSISSFQSWT